jgi:hypothetical protein
MSLLGLHRAEIVRLERERDAALALAERRAGEIARLTVVARMVTDAYWQHEGEVEHGDAIFRLTQFLDELAAAPTPDSDAEGGDHGPR